MANNRPRCSEPECSNTAAIRVSIPWADERLVCLPHGRSIGQQAGVVAEPLPETDDLWDRFQR